MDYMLHLTLRESERENKELYASSKIERSLLLLPIMIVFRKEDPPTRLVPAPRWSRNVEMDVWRRRKRKGLNFQVSELGQTDFSYNGRRLLARRFAVR